MRGDGTFNFTLLAAETRLPSVAKVTEDTRTQPSDHSSSSSRALEIKDDVLGSWPGISPPRPGAPRSPPPSTGSIHLDVAGIFMIKQSAMLRSCYYEHRNGL